MFGPSALTITIAVLVCGAIAIIFSIVASHVKHRWAFWIVVCAILIQLGLNIGETRLNEKKQSVLNQRLEKVEEQLSEERTSQKEVRQDLAEARKFSESQEKLIELFRAEFHSENHARKDASYLTEELRLKDVQYEALRVRTQHQMQLRQLESGLLSKDHFDECMNEWVRIGDKVLNPGAPQLMFPIARYTPEPTFPEEGRRKAQAGNVTLTGTIMPSGIVCDIRVAKTLGLGYDEEAVRTVYTWKFDPARQNNVPVAVRMNFEVEFRLY